jgi:hypothetical protein
MAIIYTHQRSVKRKLPKTKRLQHAKSEHAKFLASMGISVPQKRTKRINNPENMPDLTITSNAVPLSNTIPGNGYKKSVEDYKWRRDTVERKEVIEETERKKKRVAPYTNKGAYMFVTEADDAKSLGRKV